jgi:hypothetical protein
VSELVSEGHHGAPDYPIAFVWEEGELIAKRKNRILASEATILQAAISTGVAAFGKDGGKKAHASFQKLIKSLIGESDDPATPPPPQSKRRRGS